MIKALLFDLDGTLLDRDVSVYKFINNQYDRLNMWVGHIPKETYISRFIQLDCRGYVWKDRVYQQLVSELNLKNIKLEDLLLDYIERFKDSCVPYPNLHQMLEELIHYDLKLGIITNGKGQFQLDNIRALGIEHYFSTILISEWEGIKKPDTEIFKRGLQQLQVLPHESIFVGDHPKNDILPAKQLGMTTIWKRDQQWNYVEASYIINDLKEIPLLVKNGSLSH
ncbi:HAD family hydrolase [Neobacillus niacini]|uniref:HAD family hydrolase n=1 Tax=Neobacillus niacini TaxID=86668 RepID=UPI0021CB6054|nr:HAD family hydrolase [Neobacillus niacini]MCM3764251.1 HAD family hydrolase [Neobacillus niacini]